MTKKGFEKLAIDNRFAETAVVDYHSSAYQDMNRFIIAKVVHYPKTHLTAFRLVDPIANERFIMHVYDCYLPRSCKSYHDLIGETVTRISAVASVKRDNHGAVIVNWFSIVRDGKRANIGNLPEKYEEKHTRKFVFTDTKLENLYTAAETVNPIKES